jgi:hypothetical protein
MRAAMRPADSIPLPETQLVLSHAGMTNFSPGNGLIVARRLRWAPSISNAAERGESTIVKKSVPEDRPMLVLEYQQLLEEDRQTELLTAAILGALVAVVALTGLVLSGTSALHKGPGYIELPSEAYYLLPLPTVTVFAYWSTFLHRTILREAHIRLIENELACCAGERLSGGSPLPSFHRVLLPLYFPKLRLRGTWRYAFGQLIAVPGIFVLAVIFTLFVVSLAPESWVAWVVGSAYALVIALLGGALILDRSMSATELGQRMQQMDGFALLEEGKANRLYGLQDEELAGLELERNGDPAVRGLGSEARDTAKSPRRASGRAR